MNRRKFVLLCLTVTFASLVARLFQTPPRTRGRRNSSSSRQEGKDDLRKEAAEDPFSPSYRKVEDLREEITTEGASPTPVVTTEAMGSSTTISSTTAETRKRRPNIVFMFADDLGNYTNKHAALCSTVTRSLFRTGYDDVPWNNEQVLAPNLMRMAQEGVIMNNHYSQSVCTPARAALLTGYYPIRMGVQVGQCLLLVVDISVQFTASKHLFLFSIQPTGIP